MPIALVTHFLDGRKLCDEGRKAYYKIHGGEFEAARISLDRWFQWKDEVKAKHKAKVEADNENKRRKLSSSSSSNQEGTWLERVTHQTSSIQVLDKEEEDSGIQPPVHIVSRDPDSECVQKRRGKSRR